MAVREREYTRFDPTRALSQGVRDQRGADQLEHAIAVAQPAAIEHPVLACGERRLGQPEVLIRIRERAGIGGAAALLEVPLEVANNLGRELVRELISDGVLGGFQAAPSGGETSRIVHAGCARVRSLWRCTHILMAWGHARCGRVREHTRPPVRCNRSLLSRPISVKSFGNYEEIR